MTTLADECGMSCWIRPSPQGMCRPSQRAVTSGLPLGSCSVGKPLLRTRMAVQ